MKKHLSPQEMAALSVKKRLGHMTPEERSEYFKRVRRGEKVSKKDQKKRKNSKKADNLKK